MTDRPDRGLRPRAPCASPCCIPNCSAPTATGATPGCCVQRLAWRGVPAELVEAPWGEPAPASCDIYVLGGGEDSPQASAAAALIAEGVLHRAVDGGAAVLGICAGFQILGHSFFGPDGAARPGLGLLDCTTARRASPRIVGEILVEPNPDAWGGVGRELARPVGLREPRRPDRPRPRRHRRSAGSTSVSATATAPRGPSAGGSSAPTSTARCWPATRRWPT